MNREEYERLVKSSVSFREMSFDVQDRILAADGEDMERYIKIFTEELVTWKQAYNNFQKQTDQIVMDYKAELKKEKREKLVAAETGRHQQEVQNVENMISNL